MIEEEVNWVLDTDSLYQARMRFQQKKMDSKFPTELHHALWPLLYGIEGEQERRVRFADAQPSKGCNC